MSENQKAAQMAAMPAARLSVGIPGPQLCILSRAAPRGGVIDRSRFSCAFRFSSLLTLALNSLMKVWIVWRY